MVEVKVFRADLEPEECTKYVEGHRKVLEAYGVTQVTSANLSWMKEPFTYIILVESKRTGEVLGGGRIQIAGGKTSLPIETAIDQMDPNIFKMVKAEAKNGTGEYCGLWNSKKIAGFGIGSIVLVRVGVAVMSQLNLQSMFAFCSPATVPISKRVGYKEILSLGEDGTFYYPKDDLLATALLLENPEKLEFARPKEREIILDLQKNPNQRVMHYGRKGNMEIEFNLKIERHSKLEI